MACRIKHLIHFDVDFLWIPSIFATPKHKSEDRLPLTGVDVFQDGAVAQLVEQWTENPCVAGSTPAHTTVKQKRPDS